MTHPVGYFYLHGLNLYYLGLLTFVATLCAQKMTPNTPLCVPLQEPVPGSPSSSLGQRHLQPPYLLALGVGGVTLQQHLVYQF